jgi:hypothetical protein
MTIDISNIPVRSVPALKGAARELGIDLIIVTGDGEYCSGTVIVQDYFQLVWLGFVAGSNSYHNSIMPILNQLSDNIDLKIKKINDGKK